MMLTVSLKHRNFTFFTAVVVACILLALPVHAARKDIGREQFVLPTIAEGAGPMVFLEASADGINAAAFASDGTTVVVEVRRGAETPVEVREVDPTAPQYEIDVRFLDLNGFPFYIVYGGHEPIDPSWRFPPPPPAETTETSATDAHAQYALATALLETVASSEFGAGLITRRWRFERDALLETAGGIADAALIRDVEPDISETLDHGRGRRLSVNAATTTYKWEIEIHKQGAWLEKNIYADHSATVMRSISKSGVVQQTRASKNHGTAGDQMPMKCKSRATPLGMPKSLPEPLMCSTSYGIVKGKHVCNDDTYLQYQSVRDLLTPDPSKGTCSDSTLRKYAPDCW